MFCNWEGDITLGLYVSKNQSEVLSHKLFHTWCGETSKASGSEYSDVFAI